MDVIPGTDESGSDPQPNDPRTAFMADLRERQEAVWAVLCHGRIVVSWEWQEAQWPEIGDYQLVTAATIYLPPRFMDWWDERSEVCWRAVIAAADSAWTLPRDKTPGGVMRVEPILDTPDELVDFVSANIDRPKPRRFNSTAVQYVERDGVAWLTPPEVKLYDALRETDWLFVPQPSMLAYGSIDVRPDFLIFWKHRAQYAVLVEVDSDKFHSAPSVREKDETKERQLESRGFQYLRFSAKEVLRDPYAVLAQITQYCTNKWGA